MNRQLVNLQLQKTQMQMLRKNEHLIMKWMKSIRMILKSWKKQKSS